MSTSRKKVLLMGKSGSGKTSMRSIIFANYLARDTMRLGPTLGVENTHVKFLGNLTLTLWDCGGQEAFLESYFDSQRDQIFRHVEVLIYVFDIESQETKKDLETFKTCLDGIRSNSRGAHIFCLIHKMDLIHREEDRQKIFTERARELKELAGSLNLQTFATSIWDETLYKAWSSIVYSLIPNIEKLENQLNKFCKLAQADEIVLFERATFLVISHATKVAYTDAHRYEKISNIIKQFKLSCSKAQSQFRSMEVKNKNFTAFVDTFTPHTYIMVISTNPKIQSAAVNLNVQAAKPYFESFVKRTVNGR